jgi:hypothetical protein
MTEAGATGLREADDRRLQPPRTGIGFLLASRLTMRSLRVANPGIFETIRLTLLVDVDGHLLQKLLFSLV